MDDCGYIEVDLFPPDVNSLDHPQVEQFKDMLEDVAREYQSNLVYFDIDCGTITFGFDNDELTAKILKILQNDQ